MHKRSLVKLFNFKLTTGVKRNDATLALKYAYMHEFALLGRKLKGTSDHWLSDATLALKYASKVAATSMTH
jgi:hypothetical protein